MHKFLFIIGLFFPGIVFSQTLIVGRVIIHDGTPVSGVNVWCPEQNKGTSSDSTGYFELACEVPCTLEFSHVNYKKESYTLKDTRSPFIVILRNKFNNLREVVVTGRSTPGRLYSSKEGIEMIPAILGEQDILKYLATTPGIITTNAFAHPGRCRCVSSASAVGRDATAVLQQRDGGRVARARVAMQNELLKRKVSGARSSAKWCPRRDLNPHV